MQTKQILTAGVDEAGRGPLAGPVVAGAVILADGFPVDWLDDSKKLTEKKREHLYQEITQSSCLWSVGLCTVEEIDELNILQASLLAMKRALEGLSQKPELVYVDGTFTPDFAAKCEAIPKADSLIPCVSAASIIAKVTRDNIMHTLDEKFPQYQFAKHKGYPTKVHMELLKTHGVSQVHRKSYRPVQQVLNQM